jgi:hypothetical protein
MKTYPAKWNTAQLAFFLGVVGGRIGISALQKVIDDMRPVSANSSPSEYFVTLCSRVAWLIPLGDWNLIIDMCERSFK